MSADQAARVADRLLEILALTDDADEAERAFVDLLRKELAAAKREGLREAMERNAPKGIPRSAFDSTEPQGSPPEGDLERGSDGSPQKAPR
jgi:hypothetical protein